MGMKTESVSLSVMFDPLWPHGLLLAVHGISQEEYWSGLAFPSLGNLPDPGIKLESPVLQADSSLSEI